MDGFEIVFLVVILLHFCDLLLGHDDLSLVCTLGKKKSQVVWSFCNYVFDKLVLGFYFDHL